MNAFTPSSVCVVAILATAMAAVLLAGLAVLRLSSRVQARAGAWTLVAAAALFSHAATRSEPAGVRMLAVIGLVLFAMKAVVGVETAARLSLGRWLAFAALWPGMRPALFATLPGRPLPGAARLAARGLAGIAAGCGLISLARALFSATGSRFFPTVLLALPGLSLVLHFGLFHLAAAGWRAVGVAAEPLFRAPLLATSLREFWGRRWNLAFSEMTSAGIYRPVAALVGRSWGIAAAFLASGILHELAISVPARAGFGLPLIYFALQGTAVLVEGALEARETPVNGRGWIGRVWTLTWLALPLPILFHPPFLRAVVWPIAGM
jgi:hypothetical protein